MLSVILLGTGNVAHHLFKAFSKVESVSVEQVYGRNINSLKNFENQADVTSTSEAIKDADVYLIGVDDSSITEVSNLLNAKNGLVAHTSGSVPMDAIEHENRGVFYPLQSFTKGKEIDFSNIPICIEANNDKEYEVLEKLGKAISTSVHRITTKQRQALHLPAVFVNNFTNHLYQIAETLCEERDVPFELLRPLIMETADKIRFLSPNEAQTGPAKRNDIEIMQQHLDSLKNPLRKKIYQLMSESIRESSRK
ncbi:DUF2520 domain-containing protein [Allomuricauda sp. d1]|uniref:Rossmann-like and DUF2520 domain-containing protein n=1 Tax=Allomuricauda sp. d1 TaxID=3136725 RepID=UPI0031E0103E